MKLRFLLICAILTIILLPPLFLRPKDAPAGRREDSGEVERLIILTPHNETVKYEWEKAFQKYYLEKYGKRIEFDYRAPGGTSDIMRYIADRYQTEFRRYCEERNLPWNDAISAYFSNSNIPKNAPKDVFAARKLFLASDVSIGVDLMAGGGVFDLARNASRGFAVDAGIAKTHPELLKSSIIPQSFGGEKLYDAKGRYYGLCLSTFGLCYNADRIAELDDKIPPKRWDDLAQPRFYNRIVIADPSKSGSANKCFEVLIQQHMAERKSPSAGWRDGLNTIKRIIANAASVTDSAGKVTRDVSAGAAAAGMAIDTYGLTEREWNEIQFKGPAHFYYVAPEGGTAVSPDPIQLLRGAPNRKAAIEFIAFMLSKDGQKIMAFKPGTPGGPERHSLRRPPIRRDLYAPEFKKFRSDPEYDPYLSGSSFHYRPEWSGKYYTLLRLTIRAIMLDCQDELKRAWKAIIDAGGPEAVPEAMAHFNKLPFEYEKADAAARSLRRSADRSAVDVARTTRLWRDTMRENYRKAEIAARQKRSSR